MTHDDPSVDRRLEDTARSGLVGRRAGRCVHRYRIVLGARAAVVVGEEQ